MFIATALTLRGENNILSSNPQEAAHLIAKLQAGICRRDRHNGIEGEHAASRFFSPPGTDDIAHRFAIFVRRPGQQGRASFFGARIVSACLSSNRAICLNHFLIRPEDRQRNNKPKPTGSKVLQ